MVAWWVGYFLSRSYITTPYLFDVLPRAGGWSLNRNEMQSVFKSFMGKLGLIFLE